MRRCHFSASLQPSWGLHSGKRWSNLVNKMSRRWQQMLTNQRLNSDLSIFCLPPLASCANQGSGRPLADFLGSGTGPAGVSDATGPAGPRTARAAGAEDPAGEGEAAGPERAAGVGPRRRTLPAPPQAGGETGEWISACQHRPERRRGSRWNLSYSDSRGAAAGEAGGEDAAGGSKGRPQDQGPEPQRGPRSPDLQVREQSQSWNGSSFSVATAIQTSCWCVFREKMAFFTRAKTSIPNLPADDV